jgi:subtilase family serine protease
LAGDIKIQEVFLATTGEIVVRVAVDPTGSFSGNMTYKVWIDGSLAATRTEALPTGSILYWSGQTISGTHTVKVKIDTPNAYAESNEDNNVAEVSLTH